MWIDYEIYNGRFTGLEHKFKENFNEENQKSRDMEIRCVFNSYSTYISLHNYN